MISYYTKDDTGNSIMDCRLVDEEALMVARKLVIHGYDGKVDQKNSIKSSQLRKFYGDVKNLEQLWVNQHKSETAFLGILPQIKMLKAKVAYARGRGVVPQFFASWLSDNVDSISTQKDFAAFLLHFEAVVGFCYGEGLKD